ncbi:Alpha/Beta hydrolase protein [Amylostereum chailletii]|nr:Alpha/Beta hydrolase protein [Amylostereum chailletii]
MPRPGCTSTAEIAYGGVVYFSHPQDGMVYRKQVGDDEPPTPITSANVPFRYADLTIHPIYPHMIVAVLEDHTYDTPSAVINRLVAIDSNTRSLTTIVEGADFYASPRFSPDGEHVAYQDWNHPDMPWQRSAVHLALVDVNSGSINLKDDVRIAWDGHEVAVGFPTWVDNEQLAFVSDISGFINPHVYSLSTKEHFPLLPTPLAQDFAVSTAKLDISPYVVLTECGKPTFILFSTINHGVYTLHLFDIASQTLLPAQTPFVFIFSLRAISSTDVVFLASSATAPRALVQLTLHDTSGTSLQAGSIKTTYKVLKSSMGPLPFPDGIISLPVRLSLSFEDKPLHVILYMPTNPAYDGSDSPNEKPPCIVNAHGGPISAADPGLNWERQYFTSRGWAWLDVDYGWSIGYGREYSDRLRGNWGIVDVVDCVKAAGQLASPPNHRIDAARTAIRGGSAGGFTTLVALCSYPDAFPVGVSYFGVSDLGKLAQFTHKFESRYTDKLIGGSYKDIPDVYAERSPVNNADKIKSPLLILQGLDDPVVPPKQAELIASKISSRGGHVGYITFKGEGNGFVKAESIKAALEAERAFYEKIFNIKS